MDQVDRLVTADDDKEREQQHVKAALSANDYKTWMHKIPKSKKSKPAINANDDNELVCSASVGLPYINGLSEKLTHIFRQHGVSMCHKPVNTISPGRGVGQSNINLYTCVAKKTCLKGSFFRVRRDHARGCDKGIKNSNFQEKGLL